MANEIVETSVELFSDKDNRLFSQVIEEQKRQQEELERIQKERQELEQKQLEQTEIEQKQVEQQKIEEMKQQEDHLAKNIAQTTAFLVEARLALDYTKCSTALRFAKDDNATGIRCVSMNPNVTDYAVSMLILTNNFDKETMEALEATREKNALSRTVFRNHNEYERQTNAPLRDDIVASVIEDCKLNYLIEGNIRINNVANAINATKQDREKYGIRDDYIINDTVTSLKALEKNNDENIIHNHIHAIDAPRELIIEKSIDLFDRGYRASDAEKIQNVTLDDAIQIQAHCIFLENFEKWGINDDSIRQATEEIQKQNIPVEIVESFDGYVMNTNRILAQNDKEFDSKVEKGNEVVHNEVPMHTTIDTSEVGGTTKYEQADDIGTVEKKQGVLTYEEKEDRRDMEKANAETKEISDKKAPSKLQSLDR